MATKKAGGTAKNLRDSNPKYLGIKVQDGGHAKAGFVLVRQRGTKILPGNHVSIGKDHTLFARVDGIVKFTQRQKTAFDGKKRIKKIVHIFPEMAS